jgi:hypothetical protein
MMANEKRLIDADEAIRHLRGACVAKYPSTFYYGLFAAANEIQLAPTVDAVEVVHGRWIIKSKEIRPFEYVAVAACSECHVETESNRSLYISGFSMDMVDGIVRREAKNMGLGNYCPNCGADMRERKDNERKAD